MTVLIVIIVMVTNMFRNASVAWDMGTQRAEMNTSARAAVEYIARELSCAVAGSMPDAAGVPVTLKRFKLDNNPAELTTNLSFISISGDDNTLRGIRFRFDSVDRIIETCRKTSSNFKRYDDLNWDSPNSNDNWAGIALLITNVWRFQVISYDTEDDMQKGVSSLTYDSSTTPSDLLPACVDISIEMLGEANMARALSLVGPDDDPNSPRYGFVMTNSRVYTTRVFFPNRGSR